jgi:hypothetical protein
MASFFTGAAKHCRKAEHSLQLAGGIFNYVTPLLQQFNILNNVLYLSCTLLKPADFSGYSARRKRDALEEKVA